MKLIVNGKSLDTATSTLEELLVELNIPVDAIAVAIRHQVIRRGEYADTQLSEGIEVEILSPQQGG